MAQHSFVNGDRGRVGELEQTRPCDSGQDAAVERRCEEGAVADGEEVGASRLQHAPVGVQDEREPARAHLRMVEQRAVGPLVRAEPPGNREAA